MALTNQKKAFLQRLTQAVQSISNAVIDAADLISIYNNRSYSHDATGIIDADLTADSDYDYLTEAAIDNTIGSLNAIITLLDNGTPSTGNHRTNLDQVRKL